jgi:hypothetical protein
MAVSTLARIRTKVRRLTASPDEAQLSTTDLDNYINDVYEQDMPSSMRIWQLKDTYSFVTEPNVDRYAFPINTYHQAEGPAYCNGQQMSWSQSREQFFAIWPFNNIATRVALGNGTNTYTFTLTQRPVLANNVVMYAFDAGGNEMVVVDNGTGGLVLQGTTTPTIGAINYVTGVVTALVFPNAVPASNPIIARTVPYSASQPTDILYFNDTFTLRPVPNTVYPVVLNVYKRPTQFIATVADPTATPQVHRWWQFLAFGAAIKVAQDRMDMDTYQQILPFFEEQKQFIIYETAAQMHNQRAPTIYNDVGAYPQQGWGTGGTSGI